MSLRHHLPFSDFLLLLRSQGLVIGVREHQAAARLLQQYDGGRPDELATAMAALLATNPDESRRIVELFLAHYAPALQSPPPPPAASPVRRGVGLASVLLVLACLPLLLLSSQPPGPAPPPVVDMGALSRFDAGTPVPDAGEDDDEEEQARPPEPAPIPAVRVHSLPRQLATVLIPCLMIAAGLYALRRLSARRRQLRETLRDRIDNLPGPARYQLALRDLRPPLPHEDLEDVATVLARLTTRDARSRGLDVPKTLWASLRRSPLLQLVFAPLRQGHPILILQDSGPSMHLWQRKVEAFVKGMQQRGVTVERYYFEPDPSLVSRSPDSPLIPLAELYRRSSDSPLLIISTGASAVSLLGQLASWVFSLRRWPRRAWLHPVSDPERWHPMLAELPCSVWPMTRRGLLGAAYELAADDERRSLIPREGLLPGRVVTAQDIERLKQLVSLVPYASLDLAELLRQRYAPDVPEDVILHLVACGTDYSGKVLRWNLPELSRLLATLRQSAAISEEEVRRYLVELLDESEPEPGTLAHLRWRLDRAMQQVYRHDPDGAFASQALAELSALAQTEILDEVDEALDRLAVPSTPQPRGHAALPVAPPVAPRIQREVTQLIRHRERDLDSTLVATSASGPPIIPWPLPGLREVLALSLLPLLLLYAVRHAGIGVRDLGHNEYAIRLVWTPTLHQRSSEGGFLDVLRQPDQGFEELDGWIDGLTSAEPRRFKLLTEGGQPDLRVLQLDKSDLGHWVRARAPRPDGSEAQSRPLWIPGKLPPGELLVSFKSALSDQGFPNVPFIAQRGKRTEHGKSGTRLKLPVGTWQISAEVPEHGRFSHSVTILPGQLTTNHYELFAHYALLTPGPLPRGVNPDQVRIAGIPWDGKPVKVQPGEVEVTMLSDYYEYKEKIVVKANENKTTAFPQKPTHGLLELSLSPLSATITNPIYSKRPNGHYLLRLPPGKAVVRASNRGKISLHDYAVTAGVKTVSTLDLTEKPSSAGQASTATAVNKQPADPEVSRQASAPAPAAEFNSHKHECADFSKNWSSRTLGSMRLVATESKISNINLIRKSITIKLRTDTRGWFRIDSDSKLRRPINFYNNQSMEINSHNEIIDVRLPPRFADYPLLVNEIKKISSFEQGGWRKVDAVEYFDSIFGCWGVKYRQNYMTIFNIVDGDVLIIVDNDDYFYWWERTFKSITKIPYQLIIDLSNEIIPQGATVNRRLAVPAIPESHHDSEIEAGHT